MSNLSDLLPSGAGGKSFNFVASGTLPSGQTVGLRSDGKVEAITGTSTDIGTKSAAIFSAASAYGTSAYDINSDRYVIAFQNTSTGYPTAVVAQLTGTTFTFGTPVVWQSANATKEQAIYDPDQNKVVIFYQTQLGGVDNSGTGIVGNVTAGTNSITFGTAVSWMTKSNNAWSMAYDTTADRFVGHYYDNGNNNYLYGVVAAVSGTTITFGTPVVVRSTDTHSSGGTVYDAYRNKIIYVYKDGSVSNAQYAGIGTVNAGSNSISYTTAQAVGSDASQIFLTYDPVSYKTVDLYRVDGDLTTTKYRVITNSGSSLTFGAEATAFSESANIILYRPVYDVTNSRIVQPYVDVSDTSPGTYGIVYRTATISGDTVTYSDKTDLGIASDFYGGTDGLSCDQSNAKFVLPFRDNTDSTYPKAVAFTAGATNVSSYVGITEAAIANAATGAVTLQGGINTTAELGTSSSTFNTAVEVAGDGTAGSILYDPTNNKVIALYADGDNSNYGTAKVGTVSGTSTSWGSATVFESATATQIHSVYDVNAQRVVVVYQDGGNSSYPTVVIGTVAGTGISFGSPVVALSSSANIEVTYDAGQQKCLVTYRPASNSIFLMVGTVSGTSISFGSPLTVSSAANGGINGIVYDANAAKSVLFWGTGLNAEAAVATISGTSVSVGSTVQYSSGTNLQRGSAVYDSVAQKVVTVAKNSNNDDSTANVGTVSGTSISFGTEVIADSTINQSGESAIVYDVAQNKILYVFGGNPGSGQRMYSQVGTVSGTTTTWSTPVELATNYHYVWGLAYNSSTASNVLLYSDNGSADILEAQVATIAQDTLTVGSTYYVQDDGTLGTGSTSIVAGEALSATSINLVNT